MIKIKFMKLFFLRWKYLVEYFYIYFHFIYINDVTYTNIYDYI